MRLEQFLTEEILEKAVSIMNVKKARLSISILVCTVILLQLTALVATRQGLRGNYSWKAELGC